MAGEGRKCRKKGNILIVGVKLSPASRELLTWTLAKFTNPGDHVIALHVASSPPEADALTNKLENANQQVVDIFDSVIGVYEGFCSIKQIDLQVKITHGSSVRKVVAEEAKSYNAAKLILGTSGKQLALGSSFSLAKYCSKRLPSTCSVLVIQHGRVVFEKEGSLSSLAGDKSGMLNTIQRSMRSRSCKGPGQYAQGKRANESERPLDTEKHIPQGGYPHCDCGDSEDASCSLSVPNRFPNSPVSVLHGHKYVPARAQGLRSCELGMTNLIQYSSLNATRYLCQDDKKKSMVDKVESNLESLSREPFTSCEPVSDFSSPHEAGQQFSVSECTRETQGSQNLEKKVFLEPCPAPMNSEQSQRDLQVGNQVLQGAVEESPLETGNGSTPPGWPLLSRSISLTKLTTPCTKARRMSVVEWALQLPDRPKEMLKHQAETADNNCSHFTRVASPVENAASSRQGTLANGQPHASAGNSCELSSTGFSCNDKPDQCQLNTVPSLVERLDAVCQNKSCILFPFAELKAATNNFSTGNIVGKGGCSRVYQGVLSDGRVVAVKCLNPASPDSEQEFLTEAEIISGLHHPNIVTLIGYCVDSQNYLLVYNFVSKGNLEQSLNAGKDNPVLPWEIRYKVAVGVAEALDYLHDGCARPVIHRDVKSSNILLSADLEPQLTDFGLAKWAPTTSTHITCSDVVGTFGYLAPEYFMYGKVNEKTDVYSFGVVLLELITGRQPIDTSKPKGQENLVVWARPLLEDETSFEQVIDPKLDGVYNANQLKNMMIAAALCLRQSPHSRPRISRILKLLDGEGEDLDHTTRQELICKEIDEGYDMPNYGDCDIRTHLTLALLGMDDDVASQVSIDHSVDFSHSNKFLEEYLGGRYSRSSSFD